MTPYESWTPPDSLGTRIATIRKARGLSLSQLAVMSSTVKSNISEIEHDRSDPGVRLVARIAVALGVTVSELLWNVEFSENENKEN